MGQEETFLEEMDTFITLPVVMVSWVQTCQNLPNCTLEICAVYYSQLYFNKVVDREQGPWPRSSCVKGICMSIIQNMSLVGDIRAPGITNYSTPCSSGKCPIFSLFSNTALSTDSSKYKTQFSVYIAITILLHAHPQHYSARPYCPGRMSASISPPSSHPSHSCFLGGHARG